MHGPWALYAQDLLRRPAGGLEHYLYTAHPSINRERAFDWPARPLQEETQDMTRWLNGFLGKATEARQKTMLRRVDPIRGRDRGKTGA